MIKEPLFHFLCFALLIFAYFEFFPSKEIRERELSEIVIAEPEIQRLRENWIQNWRRPPSDEQLSKLIESAIKDEIYYREGILLGLDKNDSIVRNRMVQKVRFMHSEELPEPTEADLLSFLNQHASKYRAEPLYSFQQVYLGQNYDAPSAQELLKKLNKAAISPNDLGEPLSVPESVVDASSSQIIRLFGSSFAETISFSSHTRFKWFGPVISGFGTHLVSINKVQNAPTASLDDASIRRRVENDWRAMQGDVVEQRIFAKLKQKYTVQILLAE